jgi:DNA-binding transcriptional LysR family regulator
MTKAATKLHMTQPSVSLAIQELESHYNALLFERLGHRLFITEAGRRLLLYARHIINLNKQAESAMRAFGEIYRLRIGASVTIGESILVDLLQYLYKINSQQEVFSEIHNTKELETMLLKDELDIALIEGKVQSEYLVSKPFIADEMVFIASPQNSILKKEKIILSDLSKLGFFVREAGSGTRDLFEKVMYQQDINLHIVGVYNNAETIKKAVHANLGVSVISRRAVHKELERGELASFKVDTISFQRNFSIVYHKNKYISPQLQNIMDLCHKFESIS